MHLVRALVFIPNFFGPFCLFFMFCEALWTAVELSETVLVVSGRPGALVLAGDACSSRDGSVNRKRTCWDKIMSCVVT